jgi:hypothetical protein
MFAVQIERRERYSYEVFAEDARGARREAEAKLVHQAMAGDPYPEAMLSETLSEKLVAVGIAGGPYLWHCPGCGHVTQEADAVVDHVMECPRVDGTGEALPRVRRPFVWHCPGCGSVTQDGDAVPGHVLGCELVDGAGEALIA